MKKVLSLMIIVTMIFGSCSKERKLNRKLDGDWSAVTFGGFPPAPGESLTISFNKDKKNNGSCTSTYTHPGSSETETGNYILNKDEKITITFPSNSQILTVNDYSKSDMTVTNTLNEVFVFKKK